MLQAARSNKRKKWQADATAEINRLSSQENDWNLAGSGILPSRTRGKRNELSPLLLTTRGRVICGGAEDCSDLTTLEEEEEEVFCQPVPAGVAAAGNKKPYATRVMVEVQPLKDLLDTNLRPCPQCGSKLEFELKTVCLATSLRFSCSNTKGCCFTAYGKNPAPAEVPLAINQSALRTRTTDYAINILYVLGFLVSGDGGEEAQKLLGILGLPNSTTMNRRSFPTIEKRIAPVLVELFDEIVQENLINEVELTMKAKAFALAQPFDEAKFNNWKQSLDSNNNIILEPADYPALKSASTDMGWQGRGSQSLSGHAFFVGHYTRKPIAWKLYSKRCTVCQRATTGVIRVHDCSKNYDGSSKAMEANAVLEMYVHLYQQQHVRTELIIADDDSSIKAKLKWSNQDHMTNNNTTIVPKVLSKHGKLRTRPDKGGVPGDIPEPMFGADPNHRTKLVGKEAYGLARRTKGEDLTMTEMDAYRIKRNYGYMVRSIPKLNENQFEEAARAVVQHHFDNHLFCGDWCRRKELSDAQRKASGKYYRCKTKDAELYKTLRTLLDRFCTLKAMKEVAHGHDTQVNESLNGTISWHAPKNKVYSGSGSLKNRLALAIGVHSVGTLVFFTRLFGKLHINMDADVLHYLEQKDRNRSAKITRATTKEFKKKRNERHHDKLVENTKVAKHERARREGTYETGIGMDGGYTEADFEADDITIKCKRCGGLGHKTANSKGCKFYKPRTKKTADDKAKATAERDADEADKLDELPFDTPKPEEDDESDDDEFFEVFESFEQDDTGYV